MTTKWPELPSGGPRRYQLSYARFAVSLAVFLINFFWNVTLFRWVWVSQRFEWTWCPRRQRLWGPRTDIVWKWHVLTWIFSSRVDLANSGESIQFLLLAHSGVIYFWVKCLNYKIQNVYTWNVLIFMYLTSLAGWVLVFIVWVIKWS